MELTRYQSKVLDSYDKFRSQDPKQRTLVARFAPYWLLVGAIGAVLLVLMHFLLNILLDLLGITQGLGLAEFVGVWIGLMVGMIARDWGYLIRHVRFWPVMREIVDWQKVDDFRRA